MQTCVTLTKVHEEKSGELTLSQKAFQESPSNDSRLKHRMILEIILISSTINYCHMLVHY